MNQCVSDIMCISIRLDDVNELKIWKHIQYTLLSLSPAKNFIFHVRMNFSNLDIYN